MVTLATSALLRHSNPDDIKANSQNYLLLFWLLLLFRDFWSFQGEMPSAYLLIG